jgi:hypothetical protein
VIARHRFHALCPYFAMFPESFAEQWIDKLSEPGDLVVDPFCGRGTTPFQGLLMKRRVDANDISPVAYCITKAKTNAPALATLRTRITKLERAWIEAALQPAIAELPEFYRHAFAPRTLSQLMFLRSALKWRTSNVDCMVAALVLGSLHGESERSPSYLSAQMPRTIATKPDYSVRWWHAKGYRPPDRDAFALLRTKAEFRYASGVPEGRATVRLGDMRDLPRTSLADETARLAVTSPPYLDTTDFEEDQWLRAWFLGGSDLPKKSGTTDHRHRSEDRYWQLIADAWRTLGQIVSERGHVVIRIGARGHSPERLRDAVVGASELSGRRVRLISHETTSLIRRQTDSFRPGSTGVRHEVDCHFRFAS